VANLQINRSRSWAPIFVLTGETWGTDASGATRVAAHTTESRQVTSAGLAKRYFANGFTNQGSTVTAFPTGVMGARGWTIGVRGIWNGGGAGNTPGLVADSTAGVILRQTSTGVLSFFAASGTRITSTYALVAGEEFYALVYGVSGNYTLDVNGTIDTSSASAGNFANVGYVGSRNGATFDGSLIVFAWDGILPSAQRREWIEDPFSFLQRPKKPVFFGASAGGATVIDLTSAAFGFTGNSNQPAVRSSLTQASFDFTANPIQPKTTVGLTAAAFNFTANAINLGGQTIIDLSRASFNFTANAINVIKDTAINLTTAAFNFVGKVINISTPPISGGGSGGGMFMALAGFFKKRRYRQKVGKNE